MRHFLWSGFLCFKMLETKAFQSVNYKASGDDDRERTGVAAVFGNVDSGGDITHSGAFTKTLSEGRSRWKHLWNHNGGEPPIAKVTDIKEIGRHELPAEILKYAPEATGGLLVKRKYMDTPRGNEVLTLIDEGVINEMSFAYDVIKSDPGEINGQKVRNLRELALYDTSDVNWGMNPATLAAKGLITQMPLGYIIQQLQLLEKAGRRNNGSDQILINTLHDISMALGCDTCQPETPKSEEAEAVKSDTSLDLLRLEFQRLELAL